MTGKMMVNSDVEFVVNLLSCGFGEWCVLGFVLFVFLC